MTGSVVLTIAACLAAALLAVVGLAIAPTTWALVAAGAVLVAGSALVAAAVTRGISDGEDSDADRSTPPRPAAGGYRQSQHSPRSMTSMPSTSAPRAPTAAAKRRSSSAAATSRTGPQRRHRKLSWA